MRLHDIDIGWMPLDPECTADQQARRWLAARTGLAAAELPLVRDARGRPRLQGVLADHDISWSHSGEHLLLAVGRVAMLGVDLEKPRPSRDIHGIARRYFTTAEQDWLRGVAPASANTAFHRLWCAKEAVLKAHGHGISFGLDRLEFAEVEGALQLAACDPELGDAASWRLREWSPAPDHLAALAWRSS